MLMCGTDNFVGSGMFAYLTSKHIPIKTFPFEDMLQQSSLCQHQTMVLISLTMNNRVLQLCSFWIKTDLNFIITLLSLSLTVWWRNYVLSYYMWKDHCPDGKIITAWFWTTGYAGGWEMESPTVSVAEKAHGKRTADPQSVGKWLYCQRNFWISQFEL